MTDTSDYVEFLKENIHVSDEGTCDVCRIRCSPELRAIIFKLTISGIAGRPAITICAACIAYGYGLHRSEAKQCHCNCLQV